MNDGRPKFRSDVHAHVLDRGLLVLDTCWGVELLEGAGSVLTQWMKGESPSAMIAHPGDGLDELRAALAREELQRRGLLDEGEQAVGADLVEPSLVLTADYLDPRLEEVNRRALDEGRPWMLARPRGAVVWAGPVFVPGRGPCWSCMAARLRAVRAAWQLPERPAEDALVMPIGLELATLEAARWKREPESAARLLAFDTRSLAQRAHAVVRRRDCAACGNPSARRPFAPPVLESRRKTYTFDGGHRAVPPEQTWSRYEHLVSSLTGIVHHVERELGDPGSLNVFVARHNFAIGDGNVPSRSHGKGVTAAQARTGALCEALERYSGIPRGDEPLVRATFHDLQFDAVHPHACLGISDRQYDGREEWNRAVPRLLSIPERFDDTRATDWAPAWSLTHERIRHVAAALCYYGHRDPAHDFGYADSNGTAAGTCLEDAVLQGLLELVERDAVGIWWYGRIRRPAVTPEPPFLAAMRREYAERGRRLWLLDLTTDLGIPVCAAVSIGAAPESLQLGFGAHLDPAIAVTRAITEANQLLAVKRKTRVFRAALTGWSFLEPHGSRELATAARPSDDLRTDVLACVDLLRQRGLETIVLDQTREEVGLPVVKVIVPGLQHFRPRFAPGRLYDVPLQLGWIERRPREEELNPAHITA